MARPELSKPVVSSTAKSILSMAVFVLLLSGLAFWMKVR
jgi:hypothetical protein